MPPDPSAYTSAADGLLQSYAAGFNPEPYYVRATHAGASAGAALSSGIRCAGRLFDSMDSTFRGCLFG